MWHDRDIDFASRLHPAMWHVAVESWQWIHQVPAPAMWQVALGYAIEFAQTSAILEVYICFRFWPYHRSRHVILHSLQNFIQIGPPSAETNDVMSIRCRISAFLDFTGPIMGLLKSPFTTSYRSSIDTMALNCLVFEKIVFCNLATDRQTNRRTDGETGRMKPLSLSWAAA